MSTLKFLSLLNENIEIFRLTRNRATGDMAKNSLGTFKGAIEWGVERKVLNNEEEKTSKGIIFLPDNTPISESDNSLLFYDGVREYRLLQVDAIKDKRNGKLHHYEVLIL